MILCCTLEQFEQIDCCLDKLLILNKLKLKREESEKYFKEILTNQRNILKSLELHFTIRKVPQTF